ncbi:PREDICTED: beta-1,3-galactosyltransferase brn [Dinoponera quadriceps]|uniref:Hexosyltransferase n=1 Tax=Dinoponera quadriceps TaxID=609295 RepID=A0A6P3XBJ9_DINQU|nr:PREDICTED: beta-1,3-galactosyltransferase brn [Dinoponera quadriceps]
MYCLLRPCLQRCLFILKVKPRYVLLCFGAIVLLDFFGAFTHLFEITYDENFVYPYEGNIQELADALRHNEKPNIEPINEYKYPFLLHNPQKCTEAGYSTFHVVYVVKTALEHFERRAAIRKTWGYEKRFFDVPLRTIFLVGTHPDDEELQAKLKIEATKYKDIVQADFIDSYYNNTIKTMMGFKWVVKYCSNSKFYMFCDDDMYISVKNALRFVRNPAKYPGYFKEPKKLAAHKREISSADLIAFQRDIGNFDNASGRRNATIDKRSSVASFIIDETADNNNSRSNAYKGQDKQVNENFGVESKQLLGSNTSVLSRAKRQLFDFELPDDVRLFSGFVFVSSPHRHKSSKWYVSLKEYPYHLWPPYVTAGAYVLSKEALLDMYYTSFYTKHFRFDDIFLGLVAKKAEIEPFHCEDFHFYKKEYTKYNYKYVIASHGYGDPNELLQVWNEQKALGNA